MQLTTTNGFKFTIDDSDYPLLKNYTYYALLTCGKRYVRLYNRITKQYTFLHRLLTGAPRGMVVDHVNHSTLDNRRSNLRLCTASQNMANGLCHKDNTSSYKGVSLMRGRTRQWRARICVEGKNRLLGYYATEHEAALAYNKAARESFGEYALLNEVA